MIFVPVAVYCCSFVMLKYRKEKEKKSSCGTFSPHNSKYLNISNMMMIHVIFLFFFTCLESSRQRAGAIIDVTCVYICGSGKKNGVEGVSPTSDNAFPIKCSLIQGKECAVVDGASVYYSEGFRVKARMLIISGATLSLLASISSSIFYLPDGNIHLSLSRCLSVS